MKSCDYCGEIGHEWIAHPQAVADAAAWATEVRREEFPFGDHHETS